MSETTDLQLLRDPETSALYLTDGKLRMQGDLSELKPRLKPNNLNGEMLVKASGIKKLLKDCAEANVTEANVTEANATEATSAEANATEATPAEAGWRPLLLDATAGMGEDSLILAAAGFRVLMYEYDPVIAALLEDSLRRAAEDPELEPIVARMSLVNGDSIKAMKALKDTKSLKELGATNDTDAPDGIGTTNDTDAPDDIGTANDTDAPDDIGATNDKPSRIPDVILLDPMFPERRKTGLIKKKFQLLQQLESPCSDDTGEAMLKAAMDLHPKRIMVKRPAKGPFLAGMKPAYSLDGKAVRYDIY